MPTTHGKRLPHIFLDEDDGLFRNAISLGDIVNIPVPEAIEILPGLIFQAQNTVALVDPGLYDQAFMFAVIVGHSIAGGETLPPLGTPTASETPGELDTASTTPPAMPPRTARSSASRPAGEH